VNINQCGSNESIQTLNACVQSLVNETSKEKNFNKHFDELKKLMCKVNESFEIEISKVDGNDEDLNLLTRLQELVGNCLISIEDQKNQKITSTLEPLQVPSPVVVHGKLVDGELKRRADELHADIQLLVMICKGEFPAGYL
jgi:hypothetical protein